MLIISRSLVVIAIAFMKAVLNLTILLFALLFPTSRAHAIDKDEVFNNYKLWKFVKGPYVVTPQMAVLCRHVPFVGHPGTWNPAETQIKVYANELAAKVIDGGLKGLFPSGSIVVKEKLPGDAAGDSEALGIAVKHEAGFDPAHSDWEFIYKSGGKIARGPLELKNCYDCHSSKAYGDAQTSDYVFVDRY